MPTLFKELVKKILTNINIHQHGNENDILILSSPRSGSTILMEMIYTNSNIKYINEPLEKNIVDFHGYLPIKHKWNYLSLNYDEKIIFKQYLINEKMTRIFGPRNIFNKDYNLITNRRVLKVIRANSLIKWFYDEADFKIIYLVRHPIAQALSSINQGHHCEIQEYLDDKNFVDMYLNNELISYIQTILKGSNKIEKFVLEWCLDNLVPIKMLKYLPEVFFLSYEDLVLDTKNKIDQMCQKLSLNDRCLMMKTIQKPSKSTNYANIIDAKKTMEKIKNHDGLYLLSKWRSKISIEQEKYCFDILEKFEIKLYETGNETCNSIFS